MFDIIEQKSPVMMDKSELKKEIWRLKGEVDRLRQELSTYKHKEKLSPNRVQLIIDTKWEEKYKELLILYNNITGEPKKMPEFYGDAKKLIETVCHFYNIDIKDILKKSRKRRFVKARHICYFCLYYKGMKLSQIATLFNNAELNTDHSTVIHGRDKVKDEMNMYPNIEQELIKSLLGN